MKKNKEYVVCPICHHRCHIKEGEKGFCRVRGNEGGRLTALNYGAVSAMALDPIEKKPLRRFYPGSMILSVGGFGCNLHCGFCQNHHIAMASLPRTGQALPPEVLVAKAIETLPLGNIGIAFTYNEPLINFEYVLDTALLAKEQKNETLQMVLVTNGHIEQEPLLELLPFIDAMNIDLKSFSEDFYKKIGGDLQTVKQAIRLAAEACHVEVTTLIIPEENDSPDEMEALSSWLASVGSDIPLHLTQFFPQYKMLGTPPTSSETIRSLTAIARKHLQHVYGS